MMAWSDGNLHGRHRRAKSCTYSEDKESFRSLIRWIYEIYRTGKTSDVRAFDRYFLKVDNSAGGQQEFIPKNGTTLEEFLNSMN